MPFETHVVFFGFLRIVSTQRRKLISKWNEGFFCCFFTTLFWGTHDLGLFNLKCIYCKCYSCANERSRSTSMQPVYLQSRRLRGKTTSGRKEFVQFPSTSLYFCRQKKRWRLNLDVCFFDIQGFVLMCVCVRGRENIHRFQNKSSNVIILSIHYNYFCKY